MIKRLCFFIISFFILSAGRAQGKWELKKDENGIKVFTRKPETGNIKEVRVVCELRTTKVSLISILQDIQDYNSWVYSNKKSEVIKTMNFNKIIYYTQSHLPWPIKDRDLIVELNIDSSHNMLNIEAISIPDYLPKNKQFVRVPYSKAIWKVTQPTDNKLDIDYTFSVDPGGDIPTWLVNATLVFGPYNSFVKLRRRLERQK